MKIEKIAIRQDFIREFYYFDRARDGFSYLLNNITDDEDGIVLLPSFIGWSPREGSGVFDPVIASGLKYDFYPMDYQLHVDVAELEKKFKNNKVAVFVIIHYFGHVDPMYERIVEIARKNNCVILEDEAHALYSDIIDGGCGRKGDALIYSLHKMLPCKVGGVLGFINKDIVPTPNVKSACNKIFGYDLRAISEKRKQNTSIIVDQVKKIRGIKPLWDIMNDQETLQTFPVIVENADRNVIYEEMNNAGYGVVSLYHTLIPEIDHTTYPVSHTLSKKILNLPVHQDADSNDIVEMCKTLQEVIHKLNKQ